VEEHIRGDGAGRGMVEMLQSNEVAPA